MLALAALLANDHGSIPFQDGVNNSHNGCGASTTSFGFKGKARRRIDKVPKVLYEVHGIYIYVTDFMENARTTSYRSWWTAKEAASYIGVTPGTLYGYLKMRKNRPPVFRLAGKAKGTLRFPREEFIQWANGSKIG